MIRAAAFEAVGGYRSSYEWIEDHDLWLRLAQRGALANLREVVLCYRQHASSVCWQRAHQQRELMNRLMQEAYRMRDLQAPEALWYDIEQKARAPAGPGKWARAAAKGGFARTASKHLLQLIAGEAALSYKCRMTLESLARLGVSVPARLLTGSVRSAVPTFEAWHDRLEQSGILSSDREAA